MVELTPPSRTSSLESTPKRYVRGILIGFALYYVSLSFFWGFGSLYLFKDIGEMGEPSLVLIGLVGGLPTLIGLVTVNFWGYLSDRWRRRRPIMLLGFAAQILAFIIYLFVIDSFTFLVVACIASLFSTSAVPMANAYLTEARSFKGEAVGLLLATNSIGWSIGAFGGGVLYDIMGMNSLFLIGAITNIMGGFIILIFVREIPNTIILEISGGENPTPTDTVESTHSPRLKIRYLLILCLAICLGQLGINSFSFFFGIFLVSDLGGTVAMVGLANGLASLTGLVVTFAAGYGSDRFGRKPIILLGFSGYTLFFLIYLTVADPWIALMLWTLPFYALVYTAGHSVAADVTLSTQRGRAMTLVITAFSLGSGFGPIIGGALVQLLTGILRWNMLLAVALNAVALILVLFFVPETLRHARKH